MPQVLLEPEVLWCKNHLALAARYRVPVIPATIKMYDAFLVDMRTLKFCGYDAEKEQLADASKIAEALEAHLPICCFLGNDKVNEILTILATEGQTPH